MKTQLDNVKLDSLFCFSLNKMYKVRNPVGNTMKVAIKGNLRHQKTSFINQQVTCVS